MTTYTYAEAESALETFIAAVFAGQDPGYVPAFPRGMFFMASTTGFDKKEANKYHLRMTTQGIGLRGAAIGNANAEQGRRYDAEHQMVLQLYGPSADKNATDKCRKLRDIFTRALLSQPLAGIRFRNIVPDPLPLEAGWVRFNITGLYDYTEVHSYGTG